MKQRKVNMFPTGLEPAIIRVLSGRDDHYITETTWKVFIVILFIMCSDIQIYEVADLPNRPTDHQTDKPTERPTDRQTDWQTDRLNEEKMIFSCYKKDTKILSKTEDIKYWGNKKSPGFNGSTARFNELGLVIFLLLVTFFCYSVSFSFT